MATENSHLRRRALIVAAVVAVVVLAVVVAVVLRDDVTDEPVTAAPTEDAVGSPASSATPSELSPTRDSAATQVEPFEGELWFVSGERLSFGTTVLPRSGEAGGRVSTVFGPGSRMQRMAAALEALLAGPSAADQESGAASAIPEGSTLLDLRWNEGIATVDLSREFESGGGSLSMQLRVAQVVYTATQVEGLKGVRFAIEGRDVDGLGGEGLVVDRPLGRSDFLDHAPPIVVMTPKIGSTVSGSVTVSGHANVFEANVSIRVLGPDGELLKETFTTATCGSGCWGTFEETLPILVSEPERIRVEVLTYSAEDGSPQDVVSIPVRLAP